MKTMPALCLAGLRQRLRSVRRREAQLVERRQRRAEHGAEAGVELLKLWCATDAWLVTLLLLLVRCLV